jgi:hypothetical protein
LSSFGGWASGTKVDWSVAVVVVVVVVVVVLVAAEMLYRVKIKVN